MNKPNHTQKKIEKLKSLMNSTIGGFNQKRYNKMMIEIQQYENYRFNKIASYLKDKFISQKKK